MKKQVLFTVGGAALFAGGYWAGTGHTSATPPDSKHGPVTTATARAGGTEVKSSAALSDKEVRAFTAGRPFTKGGAKAWLLSLATQFNGNHRGIEVAVVDMAQLFMTMDETSASETCGALAELLALREAGDPALKAIKDGDDLGAGAYMLTVFRLSQLNPATALDALQKMPKGVPDEATKLVFGRLAGQDPARAEALVPTLPANQQGDALEGIFNSLAGQDPAAALAFAEKYPDRLGGYDRNRVLEQLVKQNSQQGIDAAVRIAEKSKDSDAVRVAFSTWLRQDQNAALAWAGQHTGPGQTAVKSLLIAQQAEGDPGAAMQEFAAVATTAGDQKELTQAASAISGQLAKRDPDAARDWITTLSEGPAKDSATRILGEIWTRDDPSAASEWIKTLPAGDTRDQAARDLVRTIYNRDPAAAYEWARSISNEASRKETIHQVMETWKLQDPETAKAAETAADQ